MADLIALNVLEWEFEAIPSGGACTLRIRAEGLPEEIVLVLDRDQLVELNGQIARAISGRPEPTLQS